MISVVPRVTWFILLVLGLVVGKLASSSDNIQAAVLLHPGPITNNDINGKLVFVNIQRDKWNYGNDYFFCFSSEVKVPIAILGAEIDNYFPAERLKQTGELLSSKPEVRNSSGAVFSFLKIRFLSINCKISYLNILMKLLWVYDILRFQDY